VIAYVQIINIGHGNPSCFRDLFRCVHEASEKCDAGYIPGEYVLSRPDNGTSALNPIGAADLIVLPCFPGTNITQVSLRLV
jgi:hypothetical protein